MYAHLFRILQYKDLTLFEDHLSVQISYMHPLIRHGFHSDACRHPRFVGHRFIQVVTSGYGFVISNIRYPFNAHDANHGFQQNQFQHFSRKPLNVE